MVHYLLLSVFLARRHVNNVPGRCDEYGVPRSPHSLQALLLSHTSSLDVPKLLFALLQLLISASVSGRPFVAPVVRFHAGDRVTLPLVVAFW